MTKKVLKTKRIGVLLGGDSSEREVSLKSGTAVYNTLRANKYNVAAIDAAKDLYRALRKEKTDIAFIALHGGHGENGAVQGLLEVMNIPYTGSGVLASALAMDKEASKKIFLHHRIPVPAFGIVRSEMTKTTRVRINFPFPWVVKPASEGSSVGVEIVRDKSAFSK